MFNRVNNNYCYGLKLKLINYNIIWVDVDYRIVVTIRTFSKYLKVIIESRAYIFKIHMDSCV